MTKGYWKKGEQAGSVWPLTKKNWGINPSWSFEKQAEKHHYNLGDKIRSNLDSPVWGMTEDGSVPIALEHEPCGYWHNPSHIQALPGQIFLTGGGDGGHVMPGEINITTYGVVGGPPWYCSVPLSGPLPTEVYALGETNPWAGHALYQYSNNLILLNQIILPYLINLTSAGLVLMNNGLIVISYGATLYVYDADLSLVTSANLGIGDIGEIITDGTILYGVTSDRKTIFRADCVTVTATYERDINNPPYQYGNFRGLLKYAGNIYTWDANTQTLLKLDSSLNLVDEGPPTTDMASPMYPVVLEGKIYYTGDVNWGYEYVFDLASLAKVNHYIVPSAVYGTDNNPYQARFSHTSAGLSPQFHIGDGSNKSFSYNIPNSGINPNAWANHMEVRVNGILKTMGVDYSASEPDTNGDGGIVFQEAPANGAEVSILITGQPPQNFRLGTGPWVISAFGIFDGPINNWAAGQQYFGGINTKGQVGIGGKIYRDSGAFGEIAEISNTMSLLNRTTGYYVAAYLSTDGSSLFFSDFDDPSASYVIRKISPGFGSATSVATPQIRWIATKTP